MTDNKRIAVDCGTMPWEERFNEHIGRALFRKNLFTDPETGMEIRLVRYPAGVINPRHTHPCGHGMYVLEGTLVTHVGMFGAGSFVWFPEGEVMEHGASPDGDVTVVFITNKTFQIDYVDAEEKSMVGSVARTAHVPLSEALAKGPPPPENLAVPIFARGSLEVELYTPKGHDAQLPHNRDEVYLVARGKGVFFDGADRHTVEAGSFLFVAAGQAHRFEEFTSDLAVWVFFYGPSLLTF